MGFPFVTLIPHLKVSCEWEGQSAAQEREPVGASAGGVLRASSCVPCVPELCWRLVASAEATRLSPVGLARQSRLLPGEAGRPGPACDGRLSRVGPLCQPGRPREPVGPPPLFSASVHAGRPSAQSWDIKQATVP